jgi:hypothetical protein
VVVVTALIAVPRVLEDGHEDAFEGCTLCAEFAHREGVCDCGAGEFLAQVAGGGGRVDGPAGPAIGGHGLEGADALRLSERTLERVGGCSLGFERVGAADIAAACFDADAAGQVRGRTVGADFAAGEDDDAVADALDLGEDVAADEDRAVLREFFDEAAGLVDLRGVQAVGGLVQEQDGRVVEERGGEADALLVAFAERADAAGTHLGEPAAFDGALDGGVAGRAGDAEEACAELEILGHGHFGVERIGLGQVAQACQGFLSRVDGVEAVDRDMPDIGGQEAGDHPDGGRLARAVVA